MKINNRYFLLRHGETLYNENGIMYPLPEKPAIRMTERGKETIKNVAKSLRGEKIDLIFSSDIFRTRQTAKIISEMLGIKPIFNKQLRDVIYGYKYQGKPKEIFETEFANPKKRFFEAPEGGESQKQIKERLESFLEKIEEKYKKKNILIISHGDPLLILEGFIRGVKTDEEFIEFIKKTRFYEVGEIRQLK